jgi:hypothetical protein
VEQLSVFLETLAVSQESEPRIGAETDEGETIPETLSDGDRHFRKKDVAWPVAIYRTSNFQQVNRGLGTVQNDNRIYECMQIDHIAYMNTKPNH